MFLNYSNKHMIDLRWTKNFPLRSLVIYNYRPIRFSLFINFLQPWCISPKIFICIGTLRFNVYFGLCWWMPEIYLSASFKKLDAAIYLRKWRQNMKHYFKKQFHLA